MERGTRGFQHPARWAENLEFFAAAMGAAFRMSPEQPQGLVPLCLSVWEARAPAALNAVLWVPSPRGRGTSSVPIS